MAKHYIAQSGSHSCLPDFCDVFQRREEAVNTLASLHELSGTQKRVLRQDGIVRLTFGADYAQVTACECGHPQLHSDSPLDWEKEES